MVGTCRPLLLIISSLCNGKEDNTLFKTGTVNNGNPSKVLSSLISLYYKIYKVSIDNLLSLKNISLTN